MNLAELQADIDRRFGEPPRRTPTEADVRAGLVGHHGTDTGRGTVRCGHCHVETPIEPIIPTPSVRCRGCKSYVRVDRRV